MKPINITTVMSKPDIRNEPGTRAPRPGSAPRIGTSRPPK